MKFIPPLFTHLTTSTWKRATGTPPTTLRNVQVLLEDLGIGYGWYSQILKGWLLFPLSASVDKIREDPNYAIGSRPILGVTFWSEIDPGTPRFPLLPRNFSDILYSPWVHLDEGVPEGHRMNVQIQFNDGEIRFGWRSDTSGTWRLFPSGVPIQDIATKEDIHLPPALPITEKRALQILSWRFIYYAPALSPKRD